MRVKPLVVVVAGAQWRSGSCPLVKKTRIADASLSKKYELRQSES